MDIFKVFGSQQGSDISEEQLQAEFNDLQNADQINETEMKDEFDYSHMTVSNRINYITGIQTLQQLILNTENTLLLLNNKMDENMFYNYRWKLERKLLTTYDELEYLKVRFEFNEIHRDIARVLRSLLIALYYYLHCLFFV